MLHFTYGLVGLAIACAALWQYGPTRHVASAALASGAVIAVVIGLAAQGTLGNVVAGLVIAFSQPIRTGDHVTIDDLTGRVSTIGVSYTRIDLDNGSHVEFPNSLLAQRAITVNRRARPPHDGQALPPT